MYGQAVAYTAGRDRSEPHCGDTQFHALQALAGCRDGPEPLLPVVVQAESQGQLLPQL